MGTYIVADLHGCFDEWMELKNRIEAQDSQVKFILVGDIVDRGPKTFELIQWAMENITSDPDGKYQMVLGNHEQEKIDWWKEYLEAKEWSRDNKEPLTSYKDFTKDNYDFQFTMKNHNQTDEQVNEIIEFFKTLPYYKEIWVDTGKKKGKMHYIIVHAFVPWKCLNKDETFKKSSINPGKKWDAIKFSRAKRNTEQIIWERNYCNRTFKNTIVIHGHTPTISVDFPFEGGIGVVPGKAYFRYGDINIDCGLCFKRDNYRNLCAIRLEDLEEFYLFDDKRTLTESQEAYRKEIKNQILGKRAWKKEDKNQQEDDIITELSKLFDEDF